ncbi:hypothetical protein BT63DRAFT_440766 [Microthyrium microscopicum]|uniref:Rhodopsin domain-containing protein n=1 Tax=Microthyrium microscopicum TaxID=703497 RepID=A0A6A6UAL9_9PEZI|nr:hypothetical protein BT63DRAFT_440766 [Microthyrium microscopicum]
MSSPEIPLPAKISKVSLLAIRIKFTGSLWVDDLLAGFALVLLLVNALLITVMADDMYATLALSNLVGLGALNKQKDFYDTVSTYMKLQFTEMVVFWTCLWMVKASFLSFFIRLTTGLPLYRRIWYATVVLTSAGYIAAMITYPLSCSSFVPMRLPLRSKFALAGIFSIGFLIVAMAMVRIIITNNDIGKRPEVSWLNLWNAVEASTAVIIVSLASFKHLFSGGIQSGSEENHRFKNRPWNPSESTSGQKSEKLTSDHSVTYRRSSWASEAMAAMPRVHMRPGKRGPQTSVTTIPLSERGTNGWRKKYGEIVVTKYYTRQTYYDGMS